MSGQQFFTFGSSSFQGSSSFSTQEGTKKPFFFSFDKDDDHNNLLDDGLDGYILKQEKKRKLRDDQVEFLEKSFEMENMKLEHDTKLKLAKDLGLQPRQVSIWFQNRRVRWKTKQMEKDYDDLETDYNSLKVNYENLHKEKARLENEVTRLKEKLKMKDEELPKILLQTCEEDQEVRFSMENRVLDSDSPHSINGDHTSNQDPGCSWHVLDDDEEEVLFLLPSHCIDPFLDYEAQIFGLLPL